ncbi:MAG: capsule assembly Wzi family protein [Calditrichaceae bacterium]
MQIRKTVFLLLILTGIGSLQAQETIPPYHWTNQYIDYLKVQGYFPELSVINRPYDRQNIAKNLLTIDWLSLSAQGKDIQIIKILLREFSFEIKQLNDHEDSKWKELIKKVINFLKSESGENIDLFFKLGAFGDFNTRYDDQTQETASNYNFHAEGGLYWKNRLTLYNNTYIFDEAEPGYIGKDYSGYYAYTEQAYLAWQSEWLRAKIGRDYMQLGPGRTGQLLISDNSRSFDMYSASIGNHTFQFSFWGFMLDRRRITDPELQQFSIYSNRYLNGHRLSVNLKDKYFFAVNEVAIYGGPNQGWEFGLMNPLMFYHGYNVNTPGVDTNTLYTIEWDLYFRKNLELYGEILIDDYQIDEETPEDLEPNEYGILVGVNWSSPFGLSGGLLNAEYVQIRNRTYNAPDNDWEKYIHRNEVIGYSLGNDLEHYFLSMSYWLRADMKLNLKGSLVRQGEGTVSGEFNKDFLNYTVEEGYDESFPFGTVEDHTQLGLSLFYKPHRIGHLELDLAYNSFDNFNHIDGLTHDELSGKISFWLEWEKIWGGSRNKKR